MRAKHALAFFAALALGVPAAAPAKGFERVVLVASDDRSVQIRASETEIDGLLSRRGPTVPRVRGGYLRLFFVAPGGFPVNVARYYPDARCVALGWARHETSCGRINAAAVRLLARARPLIRFRTRPTELASVTYLGRFPSLLTTAAELKGPVELALDGGGRTAQQPRRCYRFTGSWRGPAATVRPPRFMLCAEGVFANHRLYSLARGVWRWFPPQCRPFAGGALPCRHTCGDVPGGGPHGQAAGRLARRPPRLKRCVDPIERLTVAGRGALVMLPREPGNAGRVACNPRQPTSAAPPVRDATAGRETERTG